MNYSQPSGDKNGDSASFGGSPLPRNATVVRSKYTVFHSPSAAVIRFSPLAR